LKVAVEGGRVARVGLVFGVGWGLEGNVVRDECVCVVIGRVGLPGLGEAGTRPIVRDYRHRI
jgi:hypothetical protein